MFNLVRQIFNPQKLILLIFLAEDKNNYVLYDKNISVVVYSKISPIQSIDSVGLQYNNSIANIKKEIEQIKSENKIDRLLTAILLLPNDLIEEKIIKIPSYFTTNNAIEEFENYLIEHKCTEIEKKYFDYQIISSNNERTYSFLFVDQKIVNVYLDALKKHGLDVTKITSYTNLTERLSDKYVNNYILDSANVINLLPWREKSIRQKTRYYYIILLIVTVSILFAFYLYDFDALDSPNLVNNSQNNDQVKSLDNNFIKIPGNHNEIIKITKTTKEILDRLLMCLRLIPEGVKVKRINLDCNKLNLVLLSFYKIRVIDYLDIIKSNTNSFDLKKIKFIPVNKHKITEVHVSINLK